MRAPTLMCAQVMIRFPCGAVGDLGEKDPAEAFKKPQCSTPTILELRQTHPLLLLTIRASRR